MEQISLEDKVSNTLKWLTNQIACIQVYHWDEEYKKERLNYAWKKVQEQFKKDIQNAIAQQPWLILAAIAMVLLPKMYAKKVSRSAIGSTPFGI